MVLAVDDEAVEMIINPVKTDLQDVMQFSNGGVAVNESSPDHRTDASDHSFQLKDDRI